MKTKILICAVSFFVMLATGAETLPVKHSVPGILPTIKVDPVFTSTHAHRQGNGATFTWTTSATQEYVTSFTVIRTYEDPLDPYAEWQEVSTYPCTSARSYKCTENNVSPGYVSYRAVASMVGGGLVFSDFETVHIIQH